MAELILICAGLWVAVALIVVYRFLDRTTLGNRITVVLAGFAAGAGAMFIYAIFN